MSEYPLIGVERQKDCLIVRLSGPLDIVVGEKLVSQIKPVMTGYRKVIIDLSKVNYLDSSGLGALVAVQMTLKRQGGGLVMTGVREAPLEVMKSSQLLKILDIRNSIEEVLMETDPKGPSKATQEA